jgi:hypothetical protein
MYNLNFFVKMGSRKGSTFLFAIFISMLLMILLGGTITMFNHNDQIVETVLEDTSLFYAAQAGANHAKYILEKQDLDDFTGGKAHLPVKFVRNFTLNGCTVDIDAAFIPAHDDLPNTYTASATASLNGKSVTQTYEFINYIKFGKGTGMVSDMKKGTEFAGNGSSNPSAVNFDTFIGDMYFGGLLNMKNIPIFNGKVESACDLPSKRSKENDSYNYWQTRDDYRLDGNQSSRLRRIKAGALATGIWDKSDFNESESEIDLRFSSIFPKGYQAVDEINFDNDAVYSWSELDQNNISGVRTKKISSSNGYVRVQVTSDDKVKIYANNSTTTYNISDYNTFMFDSSISNIYFKESVVNSDIAFITSNGDFRVMDDIIVGGYSGYAEKDESWATSGNIEDLRDKLYEDSKEGLATGKISLITYNGDVLIHNAAGGNSSSHSDETKDDILLLMAAIFAPKGVYGIGSSTSSFNSFPYDSGSYKHVVSIGSVLMNQKAYFRSGGKGMYGKFCEDNRFSVDNLLPIGYKPLVVINGEHNSDPFIPTDDKMLRWSVSYQ